MYNTAPYLPRCLDSIISQFHRNIEVILVNDGSTDNSGDICEQYAQADSRVKIIHQDNAGVSAARNAGLEVYVGEWIGFVDSDDWIEPDMCQKLLSAAIASDVKMAACGQIANAKALEYVISGRGLAQSVNGKLFHKELLRDLRFDTGLHHYEDCLFVVQVISSYDINIAYVSEELYHYCKRTGSATRTFSAKRLTTLDAWEKIVKYTPKAKAYLALNAAGLALRAIDSGFAAHVSAILKRARPHMLSLITTDAIDLRMKALATMVLLFPKFSYQIWRRVWKK